MYQLYHTGIGTGVIGYMVRGNVYSRGGGGGGGGEQADSILELRFDID